MHTTPNNKRYIGITGQFYENRWKYGNGYKNQTLFYRAIQKYKWENIKHEILFSGLTSEEASEKEIELITYYKSNDNKFGYNIENGGTVNKVSEKTKLILSQIAKEQFKDKTKHPMYGKKVSDETKKKISEAQKGEKSKRYRKVGKNCINHKKVDQYDLNHNFIKKWYGSREIERELGIGHTLISKVCMGRLNTAGGYYWAYHGETPMFKKFDRNKKVSQIDIVTGEVINMYPSLKKAEETLGISYSVISGVCNGRYKTAGGYKWDYSR